MVHNGEVLTAAASRCSPKTESKGGLPRRGRPRKAGLRERVLRSAVKLFGKKSFAEVRIEEIAADAGFGKGSIYREFGSKESLYAIAITTGLRQLVSRMRSTLRTVRPGPEAIGTVIREVSAYFWNHGEFFALLRDPRALPPGHLIEFREERSGLTRLIVQTLSEGQAAAVFRADLDRELVAEALLGMIRGIRRHRSKRTQLLHAVAVVENLFMHGYLAADLIKLRSPKTLSE